MSSPPGAAAEYNFDGLIGPTHNYSGLALGNLASDLNKYSQSSPRKAALEGLFKIRLLFQLGLKQGIIPPHPRPSMPALRELGFSGTDKQILEKAQKKDFEALLSCSSASAMWTANCATISSSIDTENQKVHITPANLISQKHRAIEANESPAILKRIFSDENFFVHHAPLKNDPDYSDEGAANHMRIAPKHGKQGMNLFVYGKDPRGRLPQPKKYLARQSLTACQSIAKNHKLNQKRVHFIQQNPDVIDQGVFHNDVIGTSNENVVIYHERAYLRSKEVFQGISEQFTKLSSDQFFNLVISDDELSVEDAVQSYFFNSQLVTISQNSMALICPAECQEPKVYSLIQKLIAQDNPISRVYFVNLNQSMKNGGGPACLRLRMTLSETETKGVHPGCLLTVESFSKLESWINKHYRDKLYIDDLRDYQLLQESYAALDELTQILGLGSLYYFQQ